MTIQRQWIWLLGCLLAYSGMTLQAQEDVAIGERPAFSVPARSPLAAASAQTPALVKNQPQVRLVAFRTDVATKFAWVIPALPFAPFTRWRRWLRDHRDAVHCVLEWRDDDGQWFYSEMRSPGFDPGHQPYQVGACEFPGTGHVVCGVYILPGRVPRDIDSQGTKVELTLDEEVHCDYRQMEREIRQYGAYQPTPLDARFSSHGASNCGLGGPPYKPTQNSNTFVNYILRACGVHHPAPDKAVGWDTQPRFPCSSDISFSTPEF